VEIEMMSLDNFTEILRATRAKTPFKWNRSGIVEIAQIPKLKGRRIHIHNVITKNAYLLPKAYMKLDITILDPKELITLSSLFPKSYKK